MPASSQVIAMDPHLDKSREQPEQGEPAKRQPVSKVNPQKPSRRSARLSIASSESLEQCKPVIPKKSTTSQPRGQKRLHEAEHSSPSIPAEPSSKRLRASVETAAARPADLETPLGKTEIPVDPVGYWIRRSAWPKEYFESDPMDRILASKKSVPSLRRKRSESDSLVASSTVPSDQKSRDGKSAPYQQPRYETLLETKGSYMKMDKKGPRKESRILCQKLLNEDQDVPATSRFSDNVFQSTWTRIQGRNEAKVIQDISRLIVPSAEELADFGAEHLTCLVEAVNEGWNNSNPVTKPRPQPDYSVGFEREAFSKEQREKLAPFIGDFIAGDQSYFMATYYMYFPFFTCEVKCGAAALDVADRQNAHSMTLAVRAVVELFRLVGREKEVDREILAFSVSHDHRSVRIYGHYAVIDGSNTTFYRYPIHDFSFTALDGKEKWTTYKFTKNVYNKWMPTHFARLVSVIDSLPIGVDFDIPPLQQDSGLSQDLQSYHLSGSFAKSVAPTEDDQSQLGLATTTPDTAFTQQSAPKRRRGEASK
ncbi:hypothetical protein GQ44DRAFT_780938 [Phaeosphaeriaceae sp. PMI808]|nr:hypothetical protein GQ44DRAFT_780938 [Phaeosphaeriaceae sp. PMI808]